MYTEFWWGSPNERNFLEDLDKYENIILKRMSKKIMKGRRQNASGSILRQVLSCCEHGNEPSGSIKCGEYLDQVRR
jgi:hypothetical protein